MITQKEYDRRVAKNADLFRRQMETNTFTPSSYWLYDKKPKDLTTLKYAKLYHDIYAAAVCGVLVISDLAEKDAMEMKNGKITKVELKTSQVMSKDVYRTSRDTIYVGDRTPIAAMLSAKFSNPSRHEEDMPVYLVCSDASGKWDNQIIGAWQMTGKQAIEIIGTGTTQKEIALSKFIESGKRKKTKVKIIGWNQYVKKLLKRLPLKKTITLS